MSLRLEGFPSFASWTEDELTRFEQHLTPLKVPKGHVFVHEGAAQRSEQALFALVRGQATVTRKGVAGRKEAVFTLHEGSLFGVVAFVDGGPRAATVTAASEAEVLVLSKDAASTLEPALGARLELVIARQLAEDFAAMNQRAVAAFAEGNRAPSTGGPRWVNLASYSGLHALRSEVHEARSIRDVVATLTAARKQGRQVVLRGAGLSFDTQAMHGDLALTLVGFDDVTVDPEARTVTAGAGARWGDVLAKCARHGLVPPVVVSGSDITVGGTLSMNALSRFSPVWGKEGKWVESVEVVTASGERLVCSRAREPDLFYGVIGGFGQLALILRATWRLQPVGAPIRVENRIERSADPSRVAPALLVEPDASPTAQTPYAVVAFKGAETRSIITRSRYVNDVPLNTLLPHRPANASRVPIELAIHHVQSMGQAFWNFAYDRYLDEKATYVDELEGYTFFMDGNVRTRRTAEAMGLSFRTVQQTFVVPRPEQLAPFIANGKRLTDAIGLSLALVDVLHLPEDEPFCLSSTNGAKGFAVTFTFEGVDEVGALGRVRELFVDLTSEAVALGGRVHLTKNVFVRAGELSRLYRRGLDALLAAKKRYDPQGLLTSDFAQRLFPELTLR
ncbi:MAG: FAD-binding protein [Myxococcaceae bacterium]|nr:FAD-binding protein [Myxococcaceae bacterium]